MRVNVYAEEMTDRAEVISKEIDGVVYTGLRLYLELPATDVDGRQVKAPFIHRPGDDDSAAVTFWGKRDLRKALLKMVEALDAHYAGCDEARGGAEGEEPTLPFAPASGGKVYCSISSTEAGPVVSEVPATDNSISMSALAHICEARYAQLGRAADCARRLPATAKIAILMGELGTLARTVYGIEAGGRVGSAERVVRFDIAQLAAQCVGWLESLE